MEELERNVETLREQNENAAESKTGQPNMNIPGQLTCPRCGNQFNPKEKKCPHCGLKNNLKLCKTCGATIAKNAKRCPKCGAKNKKPIYKRVTFWAVIAILLLIVSCTASNENTSSPAASAQETSSDVIVGTWLGEMKFSDSDMFYLDESQNVRLTIKKDNTIAVRFGDDEKIYLWEFVGENNGVWQYKIVAKGDTSGSSIDFIYVDENVYQNANGSESEGLAGKIIVTTGDNSVIYKRAENRNSSKVQASTSSTSTTETPAKSNVVSSKISIGKQNALKKADEYLNVMAFSYSGLIEQLEYEGFSTEDATYAVDHCGADWMEQAAKKAEEYLNTMAFSRSGLIDQLEYEGFTSEQAKYGAEQNGY